MMALRRCETVASTQRRSRVLTMRHREHEWIPTPDVLRPLAFRAHQALESAGCRLLILEWRLQLISAGVVRVSRRLGGWQLVRLDWARWKTIDCCPE